ncbi:MAG: hypothetical protein J7K83_02925 [Candidatus Aenigmarchaeota archaeon]|nr:hypothetical protein [Candidatus Aenigmarchaeota archaeon]
MDSYDKVLIEYDHVIEIVSDMIEKEEEYVKYYLSLFMDDEDLPEKINWKYVGKIKEIANKLRTYMYDLGDKIISDAFFGENGNGYIAQNLNNIEALRMILSALRVYERYFGKDHIFVEYDQKTKNIKLLTHGLHEEIDDIDEWEGYIEKYVDMNVEIAIEYIRSVDEDKNVTIIKQMMSSIMPESDRIYDNIIKSFAVGKARRAISALIVEENVPINIKQGYNIKKVWIDKKGEPRIDIEDAIEDIVSNYVKKIRKNRKKDESMMYG